MEKPVTRIRQLITGTIACLLLLPALAQSAPVNTYRAVYLVQQYNSEIARATYELKLEDSRYHFTHYTKLTGFVSLFRDDTVMESSNIHLDNDRLLVSAYSYQQSGSSKPRDTNFTIDWQSNDNDSPGAKVSGVYANQNFTASNQGETWDPLSVLLAIQRDFQPEQDKYRYDVIAKGQLKTYVFELAGEDSIEIDDNRHQSYKLVRQHGKRTTRIWLAQGGQHIPLRIEIYKDGKLNTRMDLASLTQGADS